jgi:hypothetical protein
MEMSSKPPLEEFEEGADNEKRSKEKTDSVAALMDAFVAFKTGNERVDSSGGDNDGNIADVASSLIMLAQNFPKIRKPKKGKEVRRFKNSSGDDMRKRRAKRKRKQTAIRKQRQLKRQRQN